MEILKLSQPSIAWSGGEVVRCRTGDPAIQVRIFTEPVNFILFLLFILFFLFRAYLMQVEKL